MRLTWLFSAVFLVSIPARAQTPSAADALFEEGRAALARGDLDVACDRFARSDALDPAAGTRGSLGECEERRGRVASAWHAYRTAVDLAPTGDPRRVVIEQRMARLKPRIPHVILSLKDSPWDTTVTEGAETLGERATYGTPIPLDPGAHHLTVKASGRATVSLEVTMLEGQTTQIAVTAGPAVARASAPLVPATALAPVPMSAPPPPSPGPWIAGGIGAAGLVVGIVMGAVVLAKKGVTNSHCDTIARVCDADGLAAASLGRTLGPISTVGFVIGATGLASGLTWLLVRNSSPVATVGLGAGGLGGTW